ncbi:hypothetical protein MP638_006244, partial [Amoeboaphelidium occidentale]
IPFLIHTSDEFIVSSSNNSNNPSAGDSSKARQVQKEVDDVVGIMHDNINKVMERGEKLDSLQTKTGKFRTSLSSSRSSSRGGGGAAMKIYNKAHSNSKEAHPVSESKW